MQVVHVIPPAGQGGDRHEERFSDGLTREEIFHVLTVCGGPRPTDPPRQDGYGRLKDGSKYLDHPGTVVALGRVEGKTFVETERLQGPPA